jgi:hypothetical protein
MSYSAEEIAEKVTDSAINDPEKIYKIPESVLLDIRLTRADKDKILRNWELDQLALLRADEENMIQKTGASPAVELLERVKVVKKYLTEAARKGKAA